MDVPMILIQCANCGIPFSIPTDREQRLRECHNSFYCPMGHSLSFGGKSEIEKLRDKLLEQSEKLSAELLAKEQEINRLRALKRKRIAPKKKQITKRK